MSDRNYCVFILSNRRADRVITLKTLERVGYDGPWYIVVDNEDPTIDDYIDRYGADRVKVFDKIAASHTFDTADMSDDRRTVVYARNACWEIAKALGYDYFLQLDDDYRQLRYRRQNHETRELVSANAHRLGGLFDWMFDLLDETGATVVALSQGGDFVGGYTSGNQKKVMLRKAMNTFFCRTADTWRFVGRVNEDVNTYSSLGHRGELFLTVVESSIEQEPTQKSDGGMTSTYLEDGTYIKSFYPVMMTPSAVSVAMMITTHKRIHHAVKGRYCYPMIMRETHRKR